MDTTRMAIWLILVIMTVLSIGTALSDGSFTSNGRQKLTFPMSYHYEALYGDIFMINVANYLILQVLPPLPYLYHAGIYGAYLVGSWIIHKSWAPLSGEKPTSHFFKKTVYHTDASTAPNQKVGWWKSFSLAGWLHLFFLPAALTLFTEWAFLPRDLPAPTVWFIGFCYFSYCLTAVMGYHTAINHAKLELDYHKIAQLAAFFFAVIATTVGKLL